MAYDHHSIEHRCVDKDKVNSLVRNLETMRNEKSDLKMAVYREFDSLGEQFTDILGESTCKVTSSCCIVPIQGHMMQQIKDNSCNEDCSIVRRRPPVIGLRLEEECILARKIDSIECEEDCTIARRKDIARYEEDCTLARLKGNELCSGFEEECAIVRRKGNELCSKFEEDCNIIRRKGIEEDCDIVARRKVIEVFGAIGGKVKYICKNCDQTEVNDDVDDPTNALCQECQLYQKQYNKPRPLEIRGNNCRHCGATIWIEGKTDQNIYCDICKPKVLSIIGPEAKSFDYSDKIEYPEPPQVEAIDLSKSEAKNKLKGKPDDQLKKESTEGPKTEPMKRPIAESTKKSRGEPIALPRRDSEVTPKGEMIDLTIKIESVALPPFETGLTKKVIQLPKFELKKELAPPPKKDLPKIEIIHLPKEEFSDLNVITMKTSDTPINATKHSQGTCVSASSSEQIDLDPMEISSTVSIRGSGPITPHALGSYTESSKTLSVDYGGEQSFNQEDIRPFSRRKSKTEISECYPKANESDQGIINNQKPEEKIGHEGSSGMPQRRASEENLLVAKLSNESERASAKQNSCTGDINYFKRDETSAEQLEIESRAAASSNNCSANRNKILSAEDIDVNPSQENEEKVYQRDHNSKDRYSFEDLETYPVLSDKVSQAK